MKFAEEIMGHKKIAESQFVLSLYQNPELVHDFELEPGQISNVGWRLYYKICHDLVIDKKLTQIDSISVETYVGEKTDKFKKIYDKLGGWETIKEGLKIIAPENIESFYQDIIKYHVILELVKRGFPIKDKWELYSKLTIQELNDVLEGELNSVFINVGTEEDKVYNILDGLDEMIEKADEGIDMGLPFASPLLNSIQNGQTLGNITMLAAASGVGKSFMTMTQTIPVAIEAGEPLMLLVNEEDLAKWQKDLVTWCINFKFGAHFNKERFQQGSFTPDEKKNIKLATLWLRKKIDDGLIRFVPFNTFSMNKAIKFIKKYSDLYDVKYFIIDTLKLDNDTSAQVTDKSWLQLQQNMVKLYNVIKPSAKNVHVLVTYQLNKTQHGKFLSQNDLGMSKNVADVVTSLILMRLVGQNEKGTKGLHPVPLEGGKEVNLNEDNDYMLVFWDKNRQGSTSNQAVVKIDRGREVVKDMGLVHLSQEY